jgi:hypothetical protein
MKPSFSQPKCGGVRCRTGHQLRRFTIGSAAMIHPIEIVAGFAVAAAIGALIFWLCEGRWRRLPSERSGRDDKPEAAEHRDYRKSR